MARLQAANNAKSTLGADINDVVVSLTVADAASFPDLAASEAFLITINDEIIEVGAITKGTNTLSSLIRGQEGTVAAAHTAGDSVENRWTAGTYGEVASDADLTAHKDDAMQHLIGSLIFS